MILSFSNTNSHNRVLIISVVLVCALSACAGKQKPAPVYGGSGQTGQEPYNPVIQTTPYEITEQPVQVIPYQEAGPHTVTPPTQKPESPAVVALLNDADRNYNAGNLDSAVASIERALRIEPRNAKLVYKLAAVRLKQKKLAMAQDLANRAALLAAGDHHLKRSSWLLIAEARRLKGDNYGAKEAKQYAEQFK